MVFAAAGCNRSYFGPGAKRSVGLYNRAWYRRVHLSTINYRSRRHPPNSTDIHTQMRGSEPVSEVGDTNYPVHLVQIHNGGVKGKVVGEKNVWKLEARTATEKELPGHPCEQLCTRTKHVHSTEEVHTLVSRITIFSEAWIGFNELLSAPNTNIDTNINSYLWTNQQVKKAGGVILRGIHML